jgi:hypothetical protein
MNASLNRNLPTTRAGYSRQTDEVLVADARGSLTPSQMVERKLIGLLRDTSLPVSQLMSTLRRRGAS